MHWADVLAEEVVKRDAEPLIATGISPTGIIHVGSLREAITGESVRSAVAELGNKVRLVYLIDSVDPLRRCYDFLPGEFKNHVGKPICDIPCPCGEHETYAEHFIRPFLDAVESLNVNCEIIWTHDLYAKGLFAETIDAAFKKRDKVIEILGEVTGRDMSEDFAPYNPLCEKCCRFTAPIFDTYEFPYVEYKCGCGHKGKADIRKNQGKLVWRLEWPAKWKILGVDAEPFGKDHAAAGGSYDSGVRLVREIFDGEPPIPIPYEFVQLKGIGQMHKSTGSAVTGIDAISMTPPEVLNYMFLRVNPQRAIDYDSGLGILDMVDEYDRMEKLFFEGGWTEAEEASVRAYELAQHNSVPSKLPLQIPYRHLMNVVQMADGFDDAVRILGRTEDVSSMSQADMARLRKRMECVSFWLDKFAPDNVKFSVLREMPEITCTEADKTFYRLFADKLSESEWTGDAINGALSEAAGEAGIGNKKGYQATYRVIIGKTSGPRLGPFLADMDKDFVLTRLREAGN